MYEAEKDTIDRLRRRFEKDVSERTPEARTSGEAYLDALTSFIRTYNDGPAGDPGLARVDTTGELSRVEDQASWAEVERHRVRKALMDIM
jgi:hypothetical protein